MYGTIHFSQMLFLSLWPQEKLHTFKKDSQEII